ncbi:MAG: hypothetical protein II313_06525 [Anaerotignum sp.]|nr:hypothetical protein [Anaerotignum sp.]
MISFCSISFLLVFSYFPQIYSNYKKKGMLSEQHPGFS